MAPSTNSACPRCGGVVRGDETLCARCLLAVGEAGTEEDRIFQEALTRKSADRLPYIREAARNNPALVAAVEMLLQGYEASGGDAAEGASSIEAKVGAAPLTAAAEEPGAMIDHFRLVRLLGEGGMGSVWEAEQLAPVRRRVALKVIKLGMDTREVVKRFGRERQTLALLNHPNIAQVFEAGATTLGRPYFAMELVEGQSITSFCESKHLGLEVRLKLFQEVCAAVEHAHQKGIIHRDLKPSNILVAGGAVKVIDFGVARATQHIGDTPLFTRQAQILGTPAYMSPEQARSAGIDIDTRTDVYALGVVLYELLTGVLPIDPDRLARMSIAEMQRILLEEEPPTPSARLTTLAAQEKEKAIGARRLALRGELDWVVMKAIRKDRDERYPSAATLSEDLRRYLAGEPVSAVPPTLAYRGGKFVRRNRLAFAASLLVAAAMIAGTAVSIWQAVRANRAQRIATLTLSDMYTRSGLAAADDGEDSRAALWFANAAVIAGADRHRAEANRVRTAAWRRNVMRPIRALEIPFRDFDSLLWNPAHPAMIVSAPAANGALVWDLEADRHWNPGWISPLRMAVWNASGDRLAMLSGTNLVVCDYPSGTERARQPVTSALALAFSPDSRWLAVGSESAFVWEVETGERRPLALHQAVPSALRFSADGKMLLLQWGTLAGICDLAAPSAFLHSPVPNAAGGQAGFLADGDRYFTAGPDAVTHVRESASGVIVETHSRSEFVPLGYPVTSSPDGRFIGRSNGPVLDRTSGTAANFPAHDNVMTAVCFASDGAWFASGGADNAAKLWELPGGKLIGEIGDHQSSVQRLAFSPDGSLVASAQDGLVRVWRLARPPLIRPIPVERPSLAVLSPDTGLIAPSGWTIRGLQSVDRTRAIDIATGRAVGPDLVAGGIIMGAEFSPDGAWLAVIASTTPDRPNTPLEREPGSGNLQLWNHRSGQRLGEPIPLPSEPRGVAVHPSGKWVGICCNGGKGVEVEVTTRRIEVLFDRQHYSDSRQTLNNGRCAYSPDGRIFVVYGSPPFTHLWDRERGRELLPLDQLEGMSFDVAFSGNTVAIALLGRRSRLEFRDTRTGHPVVPPIAYSGWPFLGRFSPDGQVFLSTGRNRIGEVWEWRTGKRICPALPHDHEVMGGAFLPGRSWVVTGGHDGQIKFWDYREGMPMAPPIRREARVLDLQVTRDGGTLIASSSMSEAIDIIDLKSALPQLDLDPADAQLLAEIEASAEVHPGGDLVPLSAQEWLGRWQAFRQRHPDFPAHRLTMEPAVQRAWHEARARELAAANPAAAAWHHQRMQ